MNWKFPLALLAMQMAVQAQIEVDLNGARGHIHKVDLKNKSFQLLKETEYDPKSDITQSRFTVHWDENTTVVAVEERKSFDGVQGPVVALFQGIDKKNHAALLNCQPFEMRVVTLLSRSVQRLAQSFMVASAGLSIVFACDVNGEHLSE